MTFLRDIRFGLRALRRNPTFAAAALGLMAIGLATLLYRVGPERWNHLVALLIAVALVASLVPVVRALRIDPTDPNLFHGPPRQRAASGPR